MTTLTYTHTLSAPAAQVYNAFTTTLSLNYWFCDGSHISRLAEGQFYLVWWNNGHYATGTFLKLIPNEFIEMTWRGRGEPADTTVTVAITATDAHNTHLTVSHTGFDDAALSEQSIAAIDSGWKSALPNLRSQLETGLDRREFDRPMLGVFLSEIMTPERAERLTTSATTGVRISGTVPGLGAENAGMQEGDVVTMLNGQPITDYDSFRPALAGKIGGDDIEVTYVRGHAPHTVTMQLGKRPVPEVPSTPELLVNAMRDLATALAATLDETFAGVTEAEANHHPAEGEWNAKQAIAHCLLDVRWNLEWIASHDFNAPMNHIADNHHRLYQAFADNYTIAELVAETKRTLRVTIDLVANLTPVTAARRDFMFAIGRSVIDSLDHWHEHFAQARAAIEHARAAANQPA